MTFERLRGFRDLFPEDAEPKFYVLRKAQEVAASFGFRHIDMPSLESLDLYRLKSGEELVSQTFSFVDKGGREVTMIPEATPSVVRMLTSRKDLPRPVKWFSLPKIWRYEEPQSGRVREHIQFNADIFGPDSMEADAEIMGLAASILDSVGLEGKYNLRINDRKLMESILSALGSSDPLWLFPVIDKFRKITREEFRNQLAAAGLPSESVTRLAGLMERGLAGKDLLKSIREVVDVDTSLKGIIGRVAGTLELLETYTRSRAYIDFSVVRGLSYYTGIVFEAFDSKGEYRSIFGGGRYNNLSGLMSDQRIPAVGFGMGDVVIELLMKREGLWSVPGRPIGFYVCVASAEVGKEALNISGKLRRAGFNVSTDLSRKGLSSQLKNASSSGAEFAVIVGRNEVDTGKLTVRNLRSGSQEMKTVDELVSGGHQQKD